MRAIVLICCMALWGCDNPIMDAKIEALGGESPDTPVGEYHRPGQPCVLCHGEYYGAEPKLVIGGTVFRDRQTLMPVENAKVVLYDAVGDIYEMTTNCNGNFMRSDGERDPQFPLYAEVYCPVYGPDGQPLPDGAGGVQLKVKAMSSWISRDGSCATCHSLSGREFDSVGWVVCNETGDTNPIPDQRADCPGKPPQTGGSDGGGQGGGG